MQTKCAYCNLKATTGDLVDPPMCAKHLIVSGIVACIQARNWSVTTGTIMNYIYFRGIQAVAPYEVKGLCASMPQFKGGTE